MKKIAIVAVAFLGGILFFNKTSAQDYKTAIGIRLSSAAPIVNNSVSVKQFVSEKLAIEGLLSFGDPLALGLTAQIHGPLSAPGLKYFYGAGGYLGFIKTYDPNKLRNETNVNIGAQGVVGLDYKFANVPLNISLDWKPELNIVSDINFEPAAIGFTARFTFGKNNNP